MRICVIFTGGTIGSSPDELGILDTESSNRSKLRANLQYYQQYNQQYNQQNNQRYNQRYNLIEEFQKTRRGVVFDTFAPINVLSENITIEELNALTGCLKSIDFSAYNGIIITHGTDTLGFSAPLLGFLLDGTPVPVVITAALKNLSHPETDGHRNFKDAVEFIEKNVPGVFLCFGGKVIPAKQVRQCEPFTHTFATAPWNPEPIQQMALYNIEQLRGDVLAVRACPALDYAVFRLDSLGSDGYRAALIETFHSFTARVKGEHSALWFVEQCASRGIPVYAAPFDNQDEGCYSSTKALQSAGVIPIIRHSFEAAWARLIVMGALDKR